MRHMNRVKILSESDKQLMRDVKSVILRYVPDATVILYGSAARGEREPESDYDILILLDSALPKEKRDEMRMAIYRMELSHEAVLSVVISTLDEWNGPLVSVSPYRWNVEREGVML